MPELRYNSTTNSVLDKMSNDYSSAGLPVFLAVSGIRPPHLGLLAPAEPS